MRALLFVLCGWLALGLSVAWAYEEIQVTDGGTIIGKVTITQGTPIPKGFNLITFPDPVYCGRISTGTGWRILQEFSVAADGGLKDAVVVWWMRRRGSPSRSSRRRLKRGTAGFSLLSAWSRIDRSECRKHGSRVS